ncbi:MAG: hypothetical protein IKD45_05685 [Clostridia bacterium]|nr:hypothetical protein [Clostridia bacterium]
MKRRITCLILVVVMLMLCLASCGYSYTKDDLSKYASFDKAAFEAAINTLVIEDGNYKESDREKLQMDDIYTALAKKIDTDAKLYKGVLDTNDKIYYCYYATVTDKDGNTVTVLPTEMQTSKAANTQLGLSTLKGLAEKLSAKLAAESIDIEDYAYETVTTGEVKEGQLAYITYTVSYKDDTSRKDETYTYECVTVSASSEHPVAKKLVGSTVNKAIESFTEGDKTYTNAKVNWVVKETEEKPYKEIVLDPFVEYTVTTNKTLVNGEKLDVKDKEITYHVCPVYYYEVENFTAESVLRTLITSLTVDSLECLKDCEDLIKTFKEKLTKYDEAKKAYDTASDALDTAEKNLEKVIAAVPEGEKVEDNKSVKEATEARDKKLTEKITKEDEMDKADTAVLEAMSAIFKKVNADETKGRETVVKEYKETVHDRLLATYNSEIKENLAKKIWEVMKKNTKITGAPKKAVDEVYDRLIEQYEYDFHTGKDSASGKTNWNLHNGNFEKFLIAETAIKTNSYADAVAHVRSEAETYVKDIVVIYFVAEQYGLTYTDAELKEYKKDESGNYEYYVLQQGEANTLAAFQFDKMFDFFLESETDEDTGVVTYKHPLVKNFKIGEAEEEKKD